MKTITLKADDDFDEALTALARDMKTTKSAVIRTAVAHYSLHVSREALRRQIKRASEKVREQSLRICREMSDADNDGLDGL
jgi:predicted transcriptional regulator